ncbi:unnamed protein product [Closterium sp. NIES-54]
MHSRLLVSGLPRSLPPLLPSQAPPCLPCVKGQQRAAPHSSSFPPTTAPLHDYTRYTTVFPLRSKGQIVDVLIPWIRAVRLQLREWFRADLPVLRLHSDRGGEFSSDLLRDFCHGEGILQSFTLPDSPQQNGIAERRIGLVMEVARTSIIHAAAPHFLWPFAVWSGVLVPLSAIRPRTSSLPWPFPASSLALSLTRLAGSFTTLPRAVSSPLRTSCLTNPLPPWGPPPSGVSQVDPPSCAVPGEVAVDSGAARGTASGVAEPGGAELGGAETGCVALEGTETGGAKIGGAEPQGVEPGGAESEGAESGAAGSGGVGGAGAGEPTKSGAARGGGSGARVGGTSAGGAGAGGAGADDPRGTVRPRLYFVPLLQQSHYLSSPCHYCHLPFPVRCAAASALVDEQLDFTSACRLDYATALESASASPLSVEGECALRTDVLEDRQEDFECLAAAVPRFASMMLAHEGDKMHHGKAITGLYSSQWQSAMDAEMASWKSTGTYLDEVSPPGANIVDGMWIFRVKRPPGSPPAFKARYVARGFTGQHAQGDLAAPPTWLHWVVSCRYPVEPPPASLLRTTLAALGFAPSTADLSLFLRTNTSLPPFYVLVTSGMGLVLGGRGPVVLSGDAGASWVDDSATQRSSQGYTFSLGSGSVSWRSTCSSSVLSSSCEVEIYAGAMAALELHWLTYLLTDLGEQPRSPPVLYIDNKAMIDLCQEHRLEHKTKHIALRYFLARELQQRGQLRLAYMATGANTADIFTKALPPGDHQRFSTVLGIVPTLPHLLTT